MNRLEWTPAPESAGYLPIADYGAIGNLRTVALVSRTGSVDWWCLPELDRPSVFAALLDRRRGGFFRVAAAGLRATRRAYLGDSCVLRTEHAGEGGRLSITDFMPLSGSIVGARDPRTAPVIHRIVVCEEGEVEAEVEWAPRFDYARAMPAMHVDDAGAVAVHGDERMVLHGLPGRLVGIVESEFGPIARARVPLRAGERLVLSSGYAAPHVRHAPAKLEEVRLEPAVVEASLRETREVWERWAHHGARMPVSEWADGYEPLLIRSALTLKLLTHPETGAIAAAPTTSLPEAIGGVRNWDYRYCWVRDATFTVQALYALGHEAEAHEFFAFLDRSAEYGEREKLRLQIMYGLHGEADLDEVLLEHLEGYRGSSPVRIGNGAAAQHQLDTLGELVDGAYELARRGVEISPDICRFLSHVADSACQAWTQPDSGIWEMRGPPQHHVYSKVMAWTAIHDAISMNEKGWLQGPVASWKKHAKELRETILSRGYNPEIGAFTQSFESTALDAANLLIPVQEEFISPRDPRMLGTIDRTIEQLSVDGYVYRYRADDGLPGEEGAFAVCSFWLVYALCLAGRGEEAREIFEAMAGRANSLGLFPEQYDPRNGEFLGNFPQAFTHIGFIDALLYLRFAQGRPVPYSPRFVPDRRAEDHGLDPEPVSLHVDRRTNSDGESPL